MKEILKKPIKTSLGIIIIVFAFLFSVFLIISCWKNFVFKFESDLKIVSQKPTTILSSPIFEKKAKKTITLRKFNSDEEFIDYFRKGQNFLDYNLLKTRTLETPTISPLPSLSEESFQIGGGKKELPERFSETNVQVLGVDEPDILKTDGERIYFSSKVVFIPRPVILPEEDVIEKELYFPQENKEVKIIKAFPPSELSKLGKIEDSGDLFLIKDKNILVVFSERNVSGYDVSEPKNPQKKWKIELEENVSIVSSRLYNNKIYLITKNYIDPQTPCPIKPIILEEKPIEISCSEVYYPEKFFPTDITFLVTVIDPVSGEIEKKISFLGSSKESVVYMSENNLYITYTFYESFTNFIYQFLKTKCQDIIPNWLTEKLEKLEGYDISQQAKLLEIEQIFEKYLSSLNGDERLRIENELTNRMSDYYKEKMRDFEKSGIIKISLENFEIVSSVQISGRLLNQFALDEYRENLRVAVTVGERWFGFFRWGGQRFSANDIYILDKNLNLLGSIKDLGLTERIYSARFVEDKGYLVTFRQIDPFYVLDLSNPQKPELKGELKIPGYSSYLHPISEDKILGIGMENFQVKVSLFDVLDPSQPKEIDKYILKEGWSAILETHHAFLLDKKHQIFFLPAGSNGYIFSYKDDELKLVRAVSEIYPERAVYIGDYLYIIAKNKIIVLNEINWEKVKELKI